MQGSVILIGMPGAGKSTLGALLAKKLGKDFVDTDVLIQEHEGQDLQTLLEGVGYLQLRRIEEKVLLQTHFPHHVIATGGSAVYGDRAMAHLKRYGPVVFLDVSVEVLSTRINNAQRRGIACKPGQSLADIFANRRPLYQYFADITIDCANKTQSVIVTEIAKKLNTANST